MPIVSVPKILRAKLGDDGAEALVEFFNEAQEANSPKEEIIEIVEEKFERRLSEELGKLRVEMAEMNADLQNKMSEMKSELHNEMAKLFSKSHDEMIMIKSELHNEMTNLFSESDGKMNKIERNLRTEMAEMKASLETKIAQSHADLIKWMFIFWVGQIGVMIGILFAFFK